jgi:hypothetical protein
MQGGTHMSRSTDDGLKDAPCGTTGSKRGSMVYTYKPGATINIAIAETVPHPGYFRISFDNDGDDGFVIPTGTSGMMGDCAGDPKCGAGKEDFCSNETVLLDNLDQHAAGSFGETKKYMWSVTLPNIECDNCTIQIIQMMNDFNFHPQGYPADDIYYQCIDIVLSNSAPDVTTTPVKNNGMECKKSATPSGDAGASGSGQAGAGAAGASSTGAAGSSQAGTAATAGTASASPAGSGGTPAAPGGPGTGTPAAGTSGGTAVNRAGSSAPAAPTTSQASTASTTMAATTAPPPASNSGCSSARGTTSGLVGPLAFGMLALVLRRRATRSGARHNTRGC